jgi:hypothetical protein
MGGSSGEPTVTEDDAPPAVVTLAPPAPPVSLAKLQASVARTDLLSEAAQFQPTPPNTATATDRAKLNHRAVPHLQPIAPVCPQEPSISESTPQRNEHREVVVRPAKPMANGDLVTNATTPRPRWTPDELKAAIHAADEIAQLVGGGLPDPSSLDANAREAILASWSGGMTRSELAIALLVGRSRELKVFRDGINRIQNGGAYFQLLTGPNGVGKTFLLKTGAALAIKHGLAVVHTEFAAQDRLYDNDGASRGLLSKLISNLTFDDSESAGLVQLLDQLCTTALNGATPSAKEVRKRMEAHCHTLLLQPGGDEVVKVLSYYAQHKGDLGRQVKVIKWFRAEFDSVSEAKKELGVSSIIGDGDFLKHITMISALCRLAGKRGLLVIFDELTVFVSSLHKSVRQANFDTILNAFNASADGRSQGLGFVFAGTPDCLDPRQAGLLSHPALASRLQGASTPKGIVSSGPILELKPLRPVELFVALQKARRLALGPDGASRLPDLALEHLIDACLRPLGAQEFLAPRDVMQGFAALVQTLEADPSSDWRRAIGVAADAEAASKLKDTNPAFRDLKL